MTSQNILGEADFILFANDTGIFYQNRDPKILMDYLNDEIHCVANWLKANKLSINEKKKHVYDF